MPRNARFLGRITRVLLLLVSSSLAACGPAFISPVLRPEEVAFDRSLIGEWVEAEPEDPAHVQRASVAADPSDGYRITYLDDDGHTNHFVARLGRFAGLRVLELQPAPVDEASEGEYSRALRLPLRTLLVVSALDAEQVRFALLEPDVLERALQAESRPTPWVETDDDRVVLTADAAGLREFLHDHLARPGALGESVRFVRRR
jgi:hypothetical protein